jgi:hypothetical protein
MTRSQALDLIAVIAAAYPTWRPAEPTQRLYAKLLEPLTAELAERAVMEIIDQPGAFAPSIGDIRDRARKLALAASGAPELSAEDAWAEVQDAIRFVGFYGNPTFSNPAVQRAVDALDWRELCTNENIEATRAHFLRLFASYEHRRVEVESTKLLGSAADLKLLDQENSDRMMPAARNGTEG